MRSIWSGSISFGLINIPVKLYSGSDDHAITFDLLHRKDLSPIRYARICKEDGKEIPYSDIVKGYEYQKGEYVVFDEKDFKNIERAKTGAIDIVQFTQGDEIDSIYFERPYYLEPGKGADRPYALLRDALQASGKVAVVKFVFRNKEHIGIIKPYFDALVLDEMRYASEIRPVDELKLPKKGTANKKEIDMALKLIDQLTDKFHADEYRDEYTHDLEQAIKAKVKGIPIRSKKVAKPRSSKVHDITSLLEESLKELRHPKKQVRRKKSA